MVYAFLFDLEFPFQYKGVTDVLRIFLRSFLVTVSFSLTSSLCWEYPAVTLQQVFADRNRMKHKKLSQKIASELTVDETKNGVLLLNHQPWPAHLKHRNQENHESAHKEPPSSNLVNNIRHRTTTSQQQNSLDS